MKGIYKISSFFFILLVIAGCKFISNKEYLPGNTQDEINLDRSIWKSDQGDGTYKNPILFADYSDPDVIRVGDDYYMTSSSFNCVPGLPILHSYDLINWSVIGYALHELTPPEFFDKPQHGCGVWAPSIRYHNGEYWIYYGDPDQGIFMIKAQTPTGPWSDPLLVESGKGLIDPCPFWEDNTTQSEAYLIHAFAGSRAGVKSILVVKRMNAEGTKTLDQGVMIFDGHKDHPTVEGPKIYKRNDFYYIFAPAGGVSEGWQLVLRSKSVYGPYEVKKILHQGNTDINGPHQGAWVETVAGESWFIHFQERGAFGRVVHLQPVSWKHNWPEIGVDQNNDGIGEPVTSYRKPYVAKKYPSEFLPASDEFNLPSSGLQWQWHANPEATWGFPSGNLGNIQLYAIPVSENYSNLSMAPNLLLQKLPGPAFCATARLSFYPSGDGEKSGLLIMGNAYAYLGLESIKGEMVIIYSECRNAFENSPEIVSRLDTIQDGTIYLRVEVAADATSRFSYSISGKEFTKVPQLFIAQPGKWIGAKIGFFCSSEVRTNNAGYVDIDWFRIEKI